MVQAFQEGFLEVVPWARGGAEGQAGRGGLHPLPPLRTGLLSAQWVTSCPGPPLLLCLHRPKVRGQDQEKARGVPGWAGFRLQMPWVRWVTFC